MKDTKASRSIRHIKKDNHNTQQECNYSNNYYGDQVCILAKKGEKSSWVLKSSFYFLAPPWMKLEYPNNGPKQVNFTEAMGPNPPNNTVGNIPIEYLK